MSITDIEKVLVDPIRWRAIDYIHPNTGLGVYGNKNPADYPDYKVIAFDEFLEGQATRLCKPWGAISKTDWWEALECLPPMRWQSISGVEFFQCSEMTTSDLTATYARIGDKYWSALRSIHCDYMAESKILIASSAP